MPRPFAKIRSAFASLTGADWALQGIRFVAVVAGILIAFALDGWASGERDKQREKELAERLHAEAEDNVDYLLARRDAAQDRLLSWQRLTLAMTRDGTCPPAPEWPNLYPISRFPAVTPPSAVSDEIIAAGGLGALRDNELRSALASYRARLDYIEDEIRAFSVDPPVAAGDRRVTVDYQPSADEPVVPRYDGAALCGDRGFRDRLIAATRDQQRMIGELNWLLDSAVRLCATGARTLARQCRPGGRALSGAEASLARAVGAGMDR